MNGFIRNHEGYYDPTAGRALLAIERERKMQIKAGDIVKINRPAGDRLYAVLAADEYIYTLVLLYERDDPGNIPIVCGGSLMYAIPRKVEWCNVYKADIDYVRTLSDDEENELRAAVGAALGIEQHKAPEAPEPERIPEEYLKAVEDQAQELIRASARADVYRELYETLLERTLKNAV